MFSHPLFRALKNFRGNARACVYTEPMWGIPYNLYAPYISVYMLAFGLKDSQIGLITTIGLFFQIFAALMSGIITDKMGRKRATLVWDILAWSVPTLIWAVAQNFTYFLIAAIINSLWRITSNSWTCLMVEDTDEKQLVDIYSWVYISGLLAAFFAPLAGLLVQSYSLIPTMRGLYLFAFVMMTAKFIILNAFVKETRQGEIRMRETQGQSVFTLLKEYRSVIGQVFKTPRTLFTLGIMLVMGASQLINGTFWSILVTTKLHIPEEHLSIFAFGRSAIMLVFFFVAMPVIREMRFRNPMLVGFAGFALAQIILITIPERSYLLLLLSTFLEACSIATLGTQADRMVIVTVDPHERARIQGLLYMAVIVFTSPFGWIAGLLSEMNRNLPFLLNIGLFVIGAVLVYLASNVKTREESVSEQLPAAS